MFPNKKRKPLGQFAWVTEGKTEYHAQLLKPISEIISCGDDECEVQWTHNGLIEWVNMDQVRIESTSRAGRRRSARSAEASTSSHSPVSKKAAASPTKIKAKISPQKHSEQSTKEKDENITKINISRDTSDEVVEKTGESAENQDVKETGKGVGDSSLNFDGETPKTTKILKEEDQALPSEKVDDLDCKSKDEGALKKDHEDSVDEEELETSQKRHAEESLDSTVSHQPPPKKQRVSSIQDSSLGLFSTLSSAKDAVVSGIMGFYNGIVGSESS